jgi:hypothetical protein
MKNEIEWYLMYQTSGSPSAWSEWQIEKIGTKEECQQAEAVYNASKMDELESHPEYNWNTVITQCPEDYNDYYRED